jgi:hypothetical protein
MDLFPPPVNQILTAVFVKVSQSGEFFWAMETLSAKIVMPEI